MKFFNLADSFGLCDRFVDFFEDLPVLGLLQTDDAYSLLCNLYSRRARHWGNELCDCLHAHVLFKSLHLEGLTRQQCVSLLELAANNEHHFDAAVLCMLPATQLVDAAALEQLLRCFLQPSEASACDGA